MVTFSWPCRCPLTLPVVLLVWSPACQPEGFFFFLPWLGLQSWASSKALLLVSLDWLLQKTKQLVFCQHQFPVSIRTISDKQVLFGWAVWWLRRQTRTAVTLSKLPWIMEWSLVMGTFETDDSGLSFVEPLLTVTSPMQIPEGHRKTRKTCQHQKQARLLWVCYPVQGRSRRGLSPYFRKCKCECWCELLVCFSEKYGPALGHMVWTSTKANSTQPNGLVKGGTHLTLVCCPVNATPPLCMRGGWCEKQLGIRP